MTSRTVRRLPLFHSERDAGAYLALLDATTRDVAEWTILAYCLMPNHVHYVVDAAVDDVSKLMRYVNGCYAQRFNREHGLRGHLFQDRFHATAILNQPHLIESIRYVTLNPVRSGMCASPANWRWSSYRAWMGSAPAWPFFEPAHALSLFGSDRDIARTRLSRFVESAVPPADQPKP